MSEGKNPDFETFKEYFRKYQDKFGLLGYDVYFGTKKMPNTFASLGTDQMTRVCNAYFSVGLDKTNRKDSNPPADAKHEAIHLLLSRLQWLARCRYIGEEEIKEEVEGLTIKLTKLLPDVE